MIFNVIIYFIPIHFQNDNFVVYNLYTIDPYISQNFYFIV